MGKDTFTSTEDSQLRGSTPYAWRVPEGGEVKQESQQGLCSPPALGALGVREAQLAPTQRLEEAMTGDLGVEVRPGKLPGRAPGSGAGSEQSHAGERSPGTLPWHSSHCHYFKRTPLPADWGNAVILVTQTRKLPSTLYSRATNQIPVF